MRVNEWDSPVNPFNSWKVLFHIDQLRKIAQGDFPPPNSCDMDGSNDCPLNCPWCNAQVYRKLTDYCDMPPGHMLKLADFFADWGCKSTCLGGGGESLVNPECKEFIPYAHNKGVEVGLITNGVFLDDDYARIVNEHNRFVGVSVDAGTRETYLKMKGADYYWQVISNIERMNKVKAQTNSQLDTNIKFLIHKLNYQEIYAAASLAKAIGCSGIHIRPMSIEGVPGISQKFSLEDYMDEINMGIARAMQLNSPTFKVYAVQHKFGPNMERVVRFKKCLATPLNITFAADGWAYACFNRRGMGNFRIAQHYPDPEEVRKAWGSEAHKNMLEAISPQDCPRCTYTTYNEIIERGILRDDMFHKFT